MVQLFPDLKPLEHVTCFHCEADIGVANTGMTSPYPPLRGQYHKRCGRCGMTTYYDIPEVRDHEQERNS